MRSCLVLWAVLGAMVVAHPAGAVEWGNLKGRFVYDGDPPKEQSIDTSKEPMCSKHKVVSEELAVNGENHGLANVLVFVSSKKVTENPEYKKTAKDKVEIDNNGCRFEPHIVTMRVSQTLVIKNSDPFSHNSNLAPLGDTATNPVLTPDSSIDFKFTRVQKLPVPVACNIHPWMKGYVVVKDNPYMAVSDKDGNFEIKDLPAEELEFTVWQEKSGWLPAKSTWDPKKATFKMKIKPGDDNDLGEIKVSPKLFEKK
ncbi:MAG TPA: methylamine utilization protein [Pirellulales bacterium]|nr:methylamine utilization protein [Pirellulales bacterium]